MTYTFIIYTNNCPEIHIYTFQFMLPLGSAESNSVYIRLYCGSKYSTGILFNNLEAIFKLNHNKPKII